MILQRLRHTYLPDDLTKENLFESFATLFTYILHSLYTSLHTRCSLNKRLKSARKYGT
jgi:hypothetical protein